MRTFMALSMVLCVVAGSWFLQGPSIFWPNRFDPSHGILLEGYASRLLGVALLLVAILGVMAVRQAGYGSGRAASRRWQTIYSLLLFAALALIAIAMNSGEPGPNPDARVRKADIDAPQR